MPVIQSGITIIHISMSVCDINHAQSCESEIYLLLKTVIKIYILF